MGFLTRRHPITVLLVALLLALYAWLGWSATLGKGPAFDETAHLTAGYSYWKFNDYRFQPENGNLPQRWAGLAQLLVAPKLDPFERPDYWAAADVWNVGQRLLYETGNPAELLLAASRGAMILWGIACGVLVFLWSRNLWGNAGALLSLTLCLGSATMLAHGPMITSDMTAAFCLLAASGAFWRQLEKPSAARLGVSLLLTGLAAISKFSFLLLAPIYAALVIWHLCTRPPEVVPSPRARRFAKCGAWIAGLVLAHGLAALLLVWAAFGFRYESEAPGLPKLPDLYVAWNELLPETGPRREVLLALKEYRVLPEAYTHGLAYVLRASEARGAFAAGRLSSTGWWWFFPYTFLIKSSLAELLATGALVALILNRWLRRAASAPADLRRIAPLVALVAVYGAVSITSNLNIGHRHILPLYLPLFILAGALLRAGTKKFSRLFASSLLLLTAAETATAYPNYLAYFNPLAGSADQRWRHLVDSSLDWGQELPALSDWLRKNQRGDEPIFLTYFGSGDPRHEGIKAIQLAPYSSLWNDLRLAPLKPGLYCISATILQDTYSPLNGHWTQPLENTFWLLASYFRDHPEEFMNAGARLVRNGTPDQHRRWLFERARFARLASYLRIRKPDAVINSGMLVYRLNAEEVAIAIDASTPEMVSLIEKAAESGRD